MKLKSITTACGLALAAMSGSALAQAVTPFETPDLVVYLSGASAPQNGIGELTEQLYDKSQNFYIYADTTAASDYRAYYGRTLNTAAVPASIRGRKVLLINRARGGSVWGVNPVARESAIEVLNVTSGACTATAFVIPGLSGVTNSYICGRTGNDLAGTGRIPDFGVSDVAPFMFKDTLNVEFGRTQLSPAELAKLTIRSSSGLMMGIVATNAVPSDLDIGRQIYGTLLSGGITDWGTLRPALAGSPVLICRRVQGSGTQASYNWYFNQFPCTTGNIASPGDTIPARQLPNEVLAATGGGTGTQTDPYVIDPAILGATVIENPSSGNVRDCLRALNNGGNFDFRGEDNVTWYRVAGGTGGYRAIGNLSLDSSGRENGWSFRALEGTGTLATSVAADTAPPVFNATPCTTAVGPTRTNLVEGKYDFVSEITYQYVPSRAGAVGTLKRDFIDTFISRSGAPDVLNNIAGVQGVRAAYAALPGNGYAPTLNAAGLVTNNVARADRSANQCGPLIRQF